MPERENVFSGIHIAVVDRVASIANPFSYSKTCSTFRTVVADVATARAT